MSRSLFSGPIGLIVSFVSTFPLFVNASNVLEGPDDAPQGKIVGRGTGAVGQQNIVGSVPPDRDLRAWTVESYQGNNANYYNQYGSYSAGYPTSAYNSSYYGTTGYPAYGATGYPATTYYGAYGSPNTLYNSSYYGTTGYPATAYNAYYSAYGYPNALNDPYYGTSSLNAPYFGTYPSPNSLYDSYYGTYSPSYSPYSPYPAAYGYNRYPGYRPYYPTGNMYNPNTVFVNPPSSLNTPRYPVYSENYLYR